MTPARSFPTSERARGTIRWPTSACRGFFVFFMQSESSADVQSLRLSGDGKIVIAVDHRFALSMPALVIAPSKKSFSSVSSLILACRAFKSTGAGDADAARPNTPAAPSRSWPFHCVI